MRKINPNPELIIAGKWKKEENTKGASVSITGKVYSAPLDDSPPSVAVRNHEYGHLKVSMPREKLPLTAEEKIDVILQDAIGALEDHRTNYLLENEFGIDIKAAGYIRNVNEVCENLKTQPLQFVASLYASSRMYDIDKDLEQTMTKLLGEMKPKVDEIIKDLSATPTTTSMIQSARRFVKLFDEKAREDGEKEREEEEKRKAAKAARDAKYKPGEKKSAKDKKADNEDAEHKKAPSDGDDASDTAKADYQATRGNDKPELAEITKQDIFAYQHSQGEFGEAIIEMAPNMRNAGLYRGVKIKPRKKPSPDGATFRYVHRVLTDHACFAIPKKDSLGTILLDNSGSMNLTDKQILSILRYSAGATIATYCGRSDREAVDGRIIIMAKAGRVVKQVPQQYGYGNIIDGPALEWLCSQPAPRWWICDGLVTGIHEAQNDNLVDICTALKKKGRIKQFYTTKEFIKQMTGNRLRTYKDKCIPRMSRY